MTARPDTFQEMEEPICRIWALLHGISEFLFEKPASEPLTEHQATVVNGLLETALREIDALHSLYLPKPTS